MNWTPGPWRAQGIEIRTSGDSIAYLHGYNVEANARLIAAAPDLYAACRLLLERFERNDLTVAQIDEAMSKAEAALAKALGEKR